MPIFLIALLLPSCNGAAVFANVGPTDVTFRGFEI